MPLTNNGGFIGFNPDYNTSEYYSYTPVISYVGGNSTGYAGDNDDINHDISGISMQENDLVVVVFAVGTSSKSQLDISATGFTVIGDLYTNDLYEVTMWTGYKFMGASPDSTIVFPNGTTSNSYAGVISVHVYRGVDTTTPLDVTPWTGSTSNTAIASPGPITPVTDGAWIVALMGSGHKSGVQTYTSLTDFSELESSGAQDGGADATGGIAYYDGWSSGSYDPVDPVWSGSNSTSYAAAAITIALRPVGPINLNLMNSGIWGRLKGGMIGHKLDIEDETYYPETGTLTYIDGDTLGYTGTTSTINHDISGFSMQEDDLVIVVLAINHDEITGATGYTEIAELTSSQYITIWVGYKFMGSTPDTTITFTGGFGSVENAGAISTHVWRGVDTTTPLDVTTVTDTNLNTVIPTLPAITPTTDGSVILMAGGGGHNNGTRTFGLSGVDNLKTIGMNDTFDVTVLLASDEWSSGQYTPPSVTFSGTDSTLYVAAGTTFALRPGGGVSNVNLKNSGLWDIRTIPGTLILPQALGISSSLKQVSGTNASWTQQTVDLTDYASHEVKLVWKIVIGDSASTYKHDFQLDTIAIDGNTYNFDSDNESFQTTQYATPATYSGLSWSTVPDNTNGYWCRDSGGTGSSGTGSLTGQSGSFYIYSETSSSTAGFEMWVRSPTITLGSNPGDCTFYEGRDIVSDTGSTMDFYIDVIAQPS